MGTALSLQAWMGPDGQRTEDNRVLKATHGAAPQSKLTATPTNMRENEVSSLTHIPQNSQERRMLKKDACHMPARSLFLSCFVTYELRKPSLNSYPMLELRNLSFHRGEEPPTHPQATSYLEWQVPETRFFSLPSPRLRGRDVAGSTLTSVDATESDGLSEPQGPQLPPTSGLRFLTGQPPWHSHATSGNPTQHVPWPPENHILRGTRSKRCHMQTGSSRLPQAWQLEYV